ncbi:MAG: hypothetical protein A2172_03150 [Candidatus Woykebacteria bacterium RBG_13_40_15]|uniref:Uncharacterized protein n=1 Tax=Candidatus Woykebacteria bacterium RBG_13_40_15 TaxID=1802593 RepID=A0A1G1W5G3_9BACT|nr:MAG: hypothetical protein A2172_03150 [Candidatus Woykebacteria bacterium RBG_13_40_15]
MTKLLIYREDLKILVQEKANELTLPNTDLTNHEDIRLFALKNLGFSIRSFGQRHKDILIARRIFGDQKEGLKWVGLEEASKLIGMKEEIIKTWIDKDIEYSTKKQLELIKKVFDEFKKQKIDIFMWGGWAIDFLVGHVTRLHIDIDTLVWKKDKEKVEKIMGNLGFSMQDKIRKFQNEYEGFQFDTDFVEPYNSDFISSRSPQTKGLKWSKETFYEAFEAKMGDVQVTVINPKSLYSSLEYKLKFYKRKIGETSGPVEKTKQDLETLKNLKLYFPTQKS